MDLARNIGCFFEICTRIDFRSFFFNSLTVQQESLCDTEKKMNENNKITLKENVPKLEQDEPKIPQKNVPYLHHDKYFQKNHVNRNDNLSIIKNKVESSIQTDEPKWIIYQETSNDISTGVQTHRKRGISSSCCGTQKFKQVTTLDPTQLAKLQNNKTLIRRPLYRTRFVAIRHKRINPTPKQQPCKRNEVSNTVLPQQTKQSDSTVTFPLQNLHVQYKNLNEKHHLSKPEVYRFHISENMDYSSQMSNDNEIRKSYMPAELQKYASVPPYFQQPFSINFVPYNSIQDHFQQHFLNKNEENKVPTEDLTLQNQDQYKLSQANEEVTLSSLDNHFVHEPIKHTALYEKFTNFHGSRENQVQSDNSLHINLDAPRFIDKNLPSSSTPLQTENGGNHCIKVVISPGENRNNTFSYTKTVPFNQSKLLSKALNFFSMRPNVTKEMRHNCNEATQDECIHAIPSNEVPLSDFRHFHKNIEEFDFPKIKKFAPQPIASYIIKPLNSSLSFSNQHNKKLEVNENPIDLEALQKIEDNKEVMIQNIFSNTPANETLTISKIPTKASINFREREQKEMQAGPYDENTRRLFLETKLQPPQSIYKRKTGNPYISNSAPSYTRYDVNSRNMMVYPQSSVKIEEKILEKSPNLCFSKTPKTTIVDDQVQQSTFFTTEKDSCNAKHIPFSYNKPIQIISMPLLHSQTSKNSEMKLHPISLTPNTERTCIRSTDKDEIQPFFFFLTEKAVMDIKKNTFHSKEHVNQREQTSDCESHITQQVIQKKNVPSISSKQNNDDTSAETNVQILTRTQSKEALIRPINNAVLPATLLFDNINKSTLSPQWFVNDQSTRSKFAPISSLSPKGMSFFTDENGNVPPFVQHSLFLHSFDKGDTLLYMQANGNRIDATLPRESFIKEQDVQKKQLPPSVFNAKQAFYKTDQITNNSSSFQRKEAYRSSVSDHHTSYNQCDTQTTNPMLYPQFFVQGDHNQEKDLPVASQPPHQNTFNRTECVNLSSSFQDGKCINDQMSNNDMDSTVHDTNVTNPALSMPAVISERVIQKQSYPVSSFSSPYQRFTFSYKENNALAPIEKKDTFRTSATNNELQFIHQYSDKRERALPSQFSVSHQNIHNGSLSGFGENIIGKTIFLENDNNTNHPITNSHSNYIQHSDELINSTSCPYFAKHHVDLQNNSGNFLNVDIKGLPLFKNHHCHQNLSGRNEEIFNSPTDGSCLTHCQCNLSQSNSTLNSVSFGGNSKSQDQRELNSLRKEKDFFFSNDNNDETSESALIGRTLPCSTRKRDSLSVEYEKEVQKATLSSNRHKDCTEIPNDNKNISSLGQNETSSFSYNCSKRKVPAQEKKKNFHGCTEETSILPVSKKNNDEKANVSNLNKVNRAKSPHSSPFTKEIFYTFADENTQQLPTVRNVNRVRDKMNDFIASFINENKNSRDVDVISDTSSYRKRKETFSKKVSTAQKEERCLNTVNKNEILSYIENLRQLALQLKLKSSSEPMSTTKRPRLKLHSTDVEQNKHSDMLLNTIKKKEIDTMTYPSLSKIY
jgi:hypothetical protein